MQITLAVYTYCKELLQINEYHNNQWVIGTRIYGRGLLISKKPRI